MGLNHDFWLIEKNDFEFKDYREYLQTKPQVQIHDDLMMYMNDTLLWIPCIHISGRKKKHTKGLALYGISLISEEGAGTFAGVMDSWADLFSKAPEKFNLTGVITFKSGDDYNYRSFEVDRDILVPKLRILAEHTQKFTNQDFLILHGGI